MLALAFLLLTADPAVDAPAAGVEGPGAEATGSDAALDEGPIVDAIESVLATGSDIVRVALPPIDDPDVVRRAVLERALVRAIRDRRREEVVTPALLRARLRAQADAQALAVSIDELKPFSCDHVLVASVVTEGDATTLRLRLFSSETGQVLGESSAPLGIAASASSASAGSVRLATEDLVEQIAYALESGGVSLETHRIAVAPLSAAPGAAAASRLDRFVQAELVRLLVRRGLLVVERSRLDAAIQQAALGQELGEQGAPQVGKLAGADSLVIGQVAEAGTVFVVNLRIVDVTTGAVLGGASARLPREDVVARADVETRTPGEAAFRSAVAPGWGQAYNGHGLKSVAFAVGTYGGLLGTVGLGVASAITWRSYLDLKPGPDLTPEETGVRAAELRGLTNALGLSTIIVGAITVVLWGGGIVDALVSSPQAGGEQ